MFLVVSLFKRIVTTPKKNIRKLHLHSYFKAKSIITNKLKIIIKLLVIFIKLNTIKFNS